MTTFKDFLKEGQPFGDTVDLPFVNDAVTDPHLPDPKSWEELESYIKGLLTTRSRPPATSGGNSTSRTGKKG